LQRIPGVLLDPLAKPDRPLGGQCYLPRIVESDPLPDTDVRAALRLEDRCQHAWNPAPAAAFEKFQVAGILGQAFQQDTHLTVTAQPEPPDDVVRRAHIVDHRARLARIEHVVRA